MKVLKLVIALVLLVEFLKAQEAAPTISEERKHNRIYFNMFDLIYSAFSISYERDIKRNALMITAAGILVENNNKSKRGGMGDLQYRFNLIDEKTGYDRSAFFYFAPYAQFKYIDASEKQYQQNYYQYPYSASYTYYSTSNLRSYHAGALLGLSIYALKGRLCASFYAGGGMRYVDVKGNQALFDNSIFFGTAYSGVLPRFGFQIGVGF